MTEQEPLCSDCGNRHSPEPLADDPLLPCFHAMMRKELAALQTEKKRLHSVLTRINKTSRHEENTRLNDRLYNLGVEWGWLIEERFQLCAEVERLTKHVAERETIWLQRLKEADERTERVDKKRRAGGQRLTDAVQSLERENDALHATIAERDRQIKELEGASRCERCKGTGRQKDSQLSPQDDTAVSI